MAMWVAGAQRARERGTIVHGSVLAALFAGLLASWATAALVAALLMSPVETMGMFERKGPWGMPDALRQGSQVIMSLLTGMETKGRTS